MRISLSPIRGTPTAVRQYRSSLHRAAILPAVTEASGVLSMIPRQTIAPASRTGVSAIRAILAVFVLILSLPSEAHASLLSPEAEDKLATFLALFVIFVV